jgi:DNA-directed RNA polymerase sigma subunit (sigma70/sigma32)
MTADKRFKRRVRRQVAATGESYTAVRRRLLADTKRNSMTDLVALYLADVRAWETLDHDEECQLMASARSGDQDAQRRLVESRLQEAARIGLARGHEVGLTRLDSIREANLALMDLVASDAPDLSGLERAIAARLAGC